MGLHRLHVPARAVLALLLWVADERAACVPTWVVLTCGCRDEAEVDVCVKGRTGAALTGIPREGGWSRRATGAAGVAATVDSGDVNGLGK